MTFKESVRTCLKEKYATFSGRASRSEYWYFSLFYMLLMVVVGVLVGGLAAMGMAGDGAFEGLPLFAMIPLAIVGLLLIVPTLSVFVRRLHDRNISGFWYLGLFVVSLIPVQAVQIVTGIGGIAFLVIIMLKGTDGPNKFGDDPLGKNDGDVFK